MDLVRLGELRRSRERKLLVRIALCACIDLEFGALDGVGDGAGGDIETFVAED